METVSSVGKRYYNYYNLKDRYAYDYFVQLEQDAMKYDINEVKDLELSLEYQNGMVQLPGAKTSFDMTI